MDSVVLTALDTNFTISEIQMHMHSGVHESFVACRKFHKKPHDCVSQNKIDIRLQSVALWSFLIEIHYILCALERELLIIVWMNLRLKSSTFDLLSRDDEYSSICVCCAT
jgi:hypothetical protein